MVFVTCAQVVAIEEHLMAVLSQARSQGIGNRALLAGIGYEDVHDSYRNAAPKILRRIQSVRRSYNGRRPLALLRIFHMRVENRTFNRDQLATFDY